MTDTALDANPFRDPAHPLNVRIRLERWDGDNAVQTDVAEYDGRTVFDAEDLDMIGNDYSDLDWVFYAATAAGLIDTHDGPFTVETPEGLAEYVAHRESTGMTKAYPWAIGLLAEERVVHLQTRLKTALAEVERLREAIAEAKTRASVGL